MSWYDFIKIKKLPENRFSAILNLDKPTGPGTHWVSVFYDKSNPSVYYIDPFGLPGPDKLNAYLTTQTKKPVEYLDEQLQEDESDECGYYALEFLRGLNAGVKFSQLLKKFTPYPSEHNEELVI